MTDARGAYTLSFPTWPGGNPPALFLTLELPPGFLFVEMTNTGPPSGPCQLSGGSPEQGGSAGCRFDDLGNGPIDITLALGHVVQGSVTSGLSGAPLAGMTVWALRPNSLLIDGSDGDAIEIEAQATTDAAGRYSLTVRPGTYVIDALDPKAMASMQRFWTDDPAIFQATPLTVSGPVAGIDIALVPVTAIGGEISSGPTPIVGGIPGVRVVAYAAGGTACCKIVGVATTDDNSTFLIYLSQGTYRIAFMPAAGSPYAAEWWNDAASFATATDVTAGSEQVQLAVDLARASP